jgi:plastocyanin
VAIGISLAALIFSMAVYTEVATTNTVSIPTDLTQRLNNLQSELAMIPAVNQTPTLRNELVQWTVDPAGHDNFFQNVIVVNQGDTVDLTFLNNDTGDGHTFTLKTGPYDFQINLTAPSLINSLNGLYFTTPPTNNTAGVILSGEAGGLVGEGQFKATAAGVYKFVCVYHPFMVGYFVVLPNIAYSP